MEGMEVPKKFLQQMVKQALRVAIPFTAQILQAEVPMDPEEAVAAVAAASMPEEVRAVLEAHPIHGELAVAVAAAGSQEGPEALAVQVQHTIRSMEEKEAMDMVLVEEVLVDQQTNPLMEVLAVAAVAAA